MFTSFTVKIKYYVEKTEKPYKKILHNMLFKNSILTIEAIANKRIMQDSFFPYLLMDILNIVYNIVFNISSNLKGIFFPKRIHKIPE